MLINNPAIREISHLPNDKLKSIITHTRWLPKSLFRIQREMKMTPMKNDEKSTHWRIAKQTVERRDSMYSILRVVIPFVCAVLFFF